MRYTIATDKWDINLPRMNVEREQHCSCFLGNRLYVLAGVRYNNYEDLD